MEKIHKIEISHKTVIFTISFLVLLWLIYQLRGVILLLFISIILMSAINPGVDFLRRFKIPRIVSIAFFYALIIGFLSSVVASLIPPLIDQTTRLIEVTPHLLDSLGFSNLDPAIVFEQLSTLPSNVLRFALSAVENVIVFFTVLVFTFYLLLERNNLKNHLTLAFGKNGEKKAEAFIDKLEHRLGNWVRGQLLSMILVGLLTYIGLTLLSIEFALPLAILAGLLEIIPNIGPIVSAIPAIIVALATAPPLALGIAALYFAIQQIEAQIITPNIMHHAIGFNPLVTIAALLAGFSLGGIGGAVLSIPIILVSQTVIETIYQDRQPKKTPENS